MNDRIRGFVTRLTEAKENDLIVQVFSADYGMVSLYGRGLKKLTSKNAFACQLFDYSEFLCDYEPQRNIQLLKSATLIREFTGLKNDFDRLALASVMLEVVNNVQEEGMYPLLQQGLSLMEETEEPYTVYSIFMVEILRLLGLSPVTEECVVCGQTQGIQAISVDDGGFICHNCNKQLHIRPSDVAVLRGFRLVNRASFDLYPKALNQNLNDYQLSRLLTEFLVTHSGLVLKSWKVVNSI